MLTVLAVVLSLHFGRVFLGNVYRACPAFVMSREQLCQILGKTEMTSEAVVEDGKTVEKETVRYRVETIGLGERIRFFAHLMLAN